MSAFIFTSFIFNSLLNPILSKRHNISAYSLSSDDLDEDYVYGRSEHVDGLVERWHDALAPTDSEDDNDKSA